MTSFDDLGDYLSPTLDLPVAGRTYSVPSPPAAVGLRLQASFAVSAAHQAGARPKSRDVELLAQDTGTSFEQDALGPVYDQMIADGVNLETLNHAGMTAYLWVVAGERAARLYWGAPRGKAPSPIPSTSSSTGEANETPTPGSSSGTTSHPTPSPASETSPTA